MRDRLMLGALTVAVMSVVVLGAALITGHEALFDQAFVVVVASTAFFFVLLGLPR